jgi:hypothetical protein
LPHPYEIWGYRFIEGMGTNVKLEFDDPTMTGQYQLVLDPSVKDELLRVPGAGRALLPQRVDK